MLKKIYNNFLKKSDNGQEVQVEPENFISILKSSQGKNAIIIGGEKE